MSPKKKKRHLQLKLEFPKLTGIAKANTQKATQTSKRAAVRAAREEAENERKMTLRKKKRKVEIFDPESAAAGLDSSESETDETDEEEKRKKKKSEKIRAQHAAVAERTRNAVAEGMKKYANDDNVLVQEITGGTFFIDKQIKEKMWEFYGWEEKKMPYVHNGVLEISHGKKTLQFGALFSKFVIAHLSREDQERAKEIGFIILKKKTEGVVAEHDTNLKTSFTSADVHKLVMQKTNSMFRDVQSSNKAEKTSIYPSVMWFKKTKKWEVKVTDPATGKQKRPSFNPSQKGVSSLFYSETSARDAALALYDFLYKEDNFATYRAYVDIYNTNGVFEPMLHVKKKMSSLLKLMRPSIKWDARA